MNFEILGAFRMRITHRPLILFALLTTLSGCASTSTTLDVPSNYRGQTPKQLFISAESALAKGNYQTATERFDALDVLYPFGKYAERAHMDIIYAYFKAGDMPATVTAADQYIRLYPISRHIDYAYYMKGVANFNQDRGTLQRYVRTDLSERDPGTLRQAFKDFSQLVCMYPSSEYTPDARQRMVYIRNLLARYEMYVAHYYYCRGAYVAAINRASNVLQHYRCSPSTLDALNLMAKAYCKLGLQYQANETLSILYANAGVYKKGALH
jgi:outer membrane protein assembly factor BamD